MTTLPELKAYLNLTDTDKDAVLQGFINSAVGQLESECNRKFIRGQYTEYFDNYRSYRQRIYLNTSPVISIDAIEYLDTDTNEYTDLFVFPDEVYNSATLHDNYIELLKTGSNYSNRLKITYTAGYKFSVGTGRLKILLATPTAVEGILGTLFTTELEVGDYIIFEGVKRQVLTITDATHLTLSEAVLISVDDEDAYISVPFTVSNVPEDLRQGCKELAAMKYYESALGKNLLITSSEGMSSGASSSVNYKSLDQSRLIDYYRVMNV